MSKFEKLTRRNFLAWAMATAVTLHLAPGLLRPKEPEIAEAAVPEDCESSFPICFRLKFHKPQYKHYLPTVIHAD